MLIGAAAQGSTLLAAVPVQARPLHTPLELKNFLPFRLSGSSALSLFPNFNTMDPVQKAVINHTFGVPQKKKQVISCNICHLRFNSTNQAEAHYKGHKHARKMKALEAQKTKHHRRQLDGSVRERVRGRARVAEPLTTIHPCTTERSKLLCDSASVVKLDDTQPSSVALTPMSEVSSTDVLDSSFVSQQSDTSRETSIQQGSPAEDALGDKDPRRTKQHLYCPVCKVTVNSVTQLEAHNSGTKHKLIMEGQSILPRRRGKVLSSRAMCKSKRLANKGSLGVASKNFQCEVCEIRVNSETQLNQHMNSRRHKDRLAGKTPKPKYSPHSKNPNPTSGVLSVRWSSCAGGAVSAMKKVFNQYSLSPLASQTKLALQKQLTKNLSTSFLPTPITPPTLCTVAANPLALRHPAGATFIQTPILGPALFRPAPGPLRATHTPIIFSPY
ncbi:zinc finger protein 385D isoform X2 [Electrophorus electricus]|uniref:zinc finger protein 385D isoform X2 n=1 Tax=Electrophorus electricus TaxID=8005 RepID=UPI0015D061AC|nr:zinc finger protein 385D isoform X2 [Electrophorus electricus]